MNKQKGFTLLATLFILIILAMAGVYLIKVALTQQQIVNYSLLSSRAALAAQSALSLATQRWLENPQVCKDQTFHFGKESKALSGYDVDVNCEKIFHFPTLAPTFFALQLKAQAKRGVFGDNEYVTYQKSRWLVLDMSKSIASPAFEPLK